MDTTTKYMISVEASIFLLLGTDCGPRNFNHTLLAGLGVFLGAGINANIFGEELAIIILSMGHSEKEF